MPSSQVRSRRRAGLSAAVGVVLVVAAIAVALVALTDSGGVLVDHRRRVAKRRARRRIRAGREHRRAVRRADPQLARGLGSGIVLDGDGHVVTNAHVVAGSTTFIGHRRRRLDPGAKLRRRLPQGDLAVIAC